MTIAHTHLWWAWLGVLLGMASGALMGLFFHAEHWLGGWFAALRRILK